jgi:Spy/CpxP family protein refolding chaperone
MRKLLGGLLAGGFIVGLFLSSVLVVRADDDPKPGDQGGDAAGIGVIAKMKDKLGLTDDQVAKLKQLGESAKAEITPLWKQMGADLKALGEKVKAKAGDDVLKPLLDSINTDRQNLDAAKNKYIDQSRTILTPTQQAKMVIYEAMKWKGMMNKWGKGMKKGQGEEKDKGESGENN